MNDFTYQQSATLLGPTGGLFEPVESTPAEPAKAACNGNCAACGDAFEALRADVRVCQRCSMEGRDATRLEHMAKRLPPATTAQEFAAFHAENPHVYIALVGLARLAKRHGVKRTMKGLLEDLRSDTGLQTDGKPYKLDNSFTPYYSRLIMANCEDLRGYFEVRRSKGDT